MYSTRNPITAFRHRTALLVLLAGAALFGSHAVAQRTNTPATRDEILRGALTPLRTCYDVLSYHLDVRIDPAKKSLKGSNQIRFKSLEAFEKMQVDLFTNMVLEKIVFDDQSPANFTRELNSIFIELPRKTEKDSTHSVTIHYSGEPIVAARPPWSGGFTWAQDTNGNPWVVVTSQGTGASLWWPHKDHQEDEPDNMTISITVPPGLENISNGRLKARTELPDGWVRYDWYVSYPINDYCVTVNVGKFAHFSDEHVSTDGEKLSLDYWVLPENLEKAKEQFKQVKLMLSSFEKYFGKYPFYRDGYKLIECPHTGMEHQSAVAYGNHYGNGYRGRASSEAGRKFDFIIIHESAHEWWGNNVTSKDLADMWIHESFGAYAESLFVEDQYGHDQALIYINAKKRNVRNDRPIQGSEYGRYRSGSGDMYDKGQLVLNTLRSVIDNDNLWISVLRGIQEKFACKTVDGSDIFEYINQRSGKDLTYFFDQYLKQKNLPVLMLETKTDGDSLNVRYRWQAEVANFRMPIKVTTTPGTFKFITPTSEWQNLSLKGMEPDDFKVAEDLFLVKVQRQ